MISLSQHKTYLLSNCRIDLNFKTASKEDFSREDADLILNTFFETIYAEIEKDPELRDYLKFYLVKQTYQTVQETNQGVQELSQGVKEISQTVQEIRKVSTSLKISTPHFLTIHLP